MRPGILKHHWGFVVESWRLIMPHLKIVFLITDLHGFKWLVGRFNHSFSRAMQKFCQKKKKKFSACFAFSPLCLKYSKYSFIWFADHWEPRKCDTMASEWIKRTFSWVSENIYGRFCILALLFMQELYCFSKGRPILLWDVFSWRPSER